MREELEVEADAPFVQPILGKSLAKASIGCSTNSV